MRRIVLWLLGVVCALGVYFLYPPGQRVIRFPDGKKFAFTIVDDTDLATLERIKPLYDVMYAAGLRTTKTVWVVEHSDDPEYTDKGATLRDPVYRAFILDLKSKGFEIALHGCTRRECAARDVAERARRVQHGDGFLSPSSRQPRPQPRESLLGPPPMDVRAVPLELPGGEIVSNTPATCQSRRSFGEMRHSSGSSMSAASPSATSTRFA